MHAIMDCAGEAYTIDKDEHTAIGCAHKVHSSNQQTGQEMKARTIDTTELIRNTHWH